VESDRFYFKLLLIALLGVCSCQTWAGDSIGGDFSLTDQDGRSFQLNQLGGKVVLLFFGYTFCPDICPTELASLAAVLNALEDDTEQVQAVFVTVDPERDTPEVLKSYVSYFNKNLIGLTGSSDQIAQVTNRYRVKFHKHSRPGGAYSIDHSANLYVINRAGQLAMVVPYGLPPEHVLSVVRHLLIDDPGS
jgi:protein SCO1/2